MTSNKGVPFDPVDLTVLGDVGQSGVPVNDEVRALIKRLGAEITNAASNGKASITIKIVLKRVGSESLTIHHEVNHTPPKKDRLAMVAHLDPANGDFVTQDHRQMELSGDRVVALKKQEKTNAG
jgi:hypothetical protein